MIDRKINTTGSLRESRRRVMPDLGVPISDDRIDDTNNSSEIIDEDGVLQED